MERHLNYLDYQNIINAIPGGVAPSIKSQIFLRPSTIPTACLSCAAIPAPNTTS